VPIQAGTLEMKQTNTDRFLEIAIHIKKIILEYKPDHLALETQYIAGRF
jgi:Holliday junction resolvasome RuvABC endonuclease subunit